MGKVEDGVHYFDDFDLNVHILYDDTTVLPNPGDSVGSLLLDREVAALQALNDVLDVMSRDVVLG